MAKRENPPLQMAAIFYGHTSKQPKQWNRMVNRAVQEASDDPDFISNLETDLILTLGKSTYVSMM